MSNDVLDILGEDVISESEQPGDALLTFNPHEGQYAFIESPASQKEAEGGNRTGKTEVVIAECVSYAIGYRPWLPQDHPLYKTPFKPPIKIRISAEDLKKGIGQDILPKLKRFTPKTHFDPTNGVGHSRKDANTGVDVIWTLANGSTIEMLSYEMEPASAEGWSGHLAIFNEPPPRSLYIAIFRGLTDFGGHVLFAMTPLKEPWVTREIYGRADSVKHFMRDRETGEILVDEKRSVKDVPSDIHAFTWDISVNVGYGLEWDKVDRFAASLTPEERECRLHGKPLHFQGMVFKEFNRTAHVVEGELDRNQPYTFYESYDPHARTPHAVGFYAVGRDGIPIKYDEISKRHQPSGACSPPELATMVMAKRKGEPVFMMGDPSAFTESYGDESFSTRLERASGGRIALEKGSKDLVGGVSAIQEALRLRNGYPGYRILSKCEETIWEYENLIYDEHKGKTADRKTESNRPMDKDDHHVECDRRAFLGGMRFMPNYAYMDGKPYYEHEDYEHSVTLSNDTGRDAQTGY